MVDGKEVEFVTEVSDYRSVDGLQFPHRIDAAAELVDRQRRPSKVHITCCSTARASRCPAGLVAAGKPAVPPAVRPPGNHPAMPRAAPAEETMAGWIWVLGGLFSSRR